MFVGFTKMKRVTDPFDDMARARIVGHSDKTGPDRVADDVTAPASLSELFYGFYASDSSPATGDSDFDPDDGGGGGDSVSTAAADVIGSIVEESQRDAYGVALAAHVRKAAQAFAPACGGNKQVLRRNVMAYLRNFGYDAAICKTKWEKCGGLSAGDYEFIDVLRAGADTPARYLVDLDFAAEFEIARRTECYERLMRRLPAVFVGTSDGLKQILRVASDAARRSMKSGGLHLPPWRRHRFMQNKWLGPCRRSANVFAAAKQGYGVKCRAVGFDAAVNGGGHFLLPATTAHTRWFGWEN